MSSPARGKIKTPDGRIVEITDQEFQYGRWWNKEIDQFNREIHSFRNPMPLEKGGELPAGGGPSRVANQFLAKSIILRSSFGRLANSRDASVSA